MANFTHKNNIADMASMMDIIEAMTNFLVQNNQDDPVIDKIVLCLDELISNIHKYGYVHSPNNKPIFLNCSLEANNIQVILTDNSHKFDPFQIDYANSPDDKIEDWQIGRLGMKLVKSMARTHDYQYINQQNIVTLTFDAA